MPEWLHTLFQLFLGALFYGVGYWSGKSDLIKRRKLYRESKVLVRRYSWPEATRPKNLRGAGACDSCGVDADTWCTDDCEYLDPWDYR